MVGRTDSAGITEIGVGLISVGWMGKLHSRAYQAIPLVYPELKIRPRLIHAADTAADRADYARDVLGYAKGSTDYRAVLADPDVDIVSICAPNLLHKEIGIAAAQAGKPFWIEKPVGRDAADTAAVAAAAQTAGVATSIENGLPVCAAAIPISLCSRFGAQIDTMSTSGSASTAR